MKKKSKRLRAWTRIEPREFARVWRSNNSALAVAEHFGISHQSARSRAFLLREKGVKLKRYKSGRKPRK